MCVSSCSKVQEHGAWRVVSALPALLSSGSGESTEGRLAEETAEYHEKLAAALVCPADWSSVFLQGPGWNQGTGDAYKIAHLIYTYTRQVPHVTCCPRRLHCCMFGLILVKAWYIFKLHEFIWLVFSPRAGRFIVCSSNLKIAYWFF